MTTEAAFLLAALQGTAMPAAELLDWQALMHLAQSHGVLPLLCSRRGDNLPEEFSAAARSQWTTSAFLATELQHLLQQFSAQRIQVIPLKGPLLAQSLYGSVGLRPCDDLDLLVLPQDFAGAESLLMNLDYAPVQAADDYHRTFFKNHSASPATCTPSGAIPSGGEKSAGFSIGNHSQPQPTRSPSQTCVELHFAVAPPSSPSIDLPGAWKRASQVEFRGQPARSFSQPDLLLYLTLHGIKHDFARLIWILDAARVIGKMNEEEHREVLSRAGHLGIEAALLTTVALAHKSSGRPLTGLFAAAIERTPGVSEHATRLWHKILAGPADPKTEHQGAGTFIQLEPRARRRWAQRLRLFRPSQHDQLWATQHGISPHGMWLLRPFRLLLKHGPAAVWRTLFPRFAAKAPVSF